jgi:hypothetical protein
MEEEQIQNFVAQLFAQFDAKLEQQAQLMHEGFAEFQRAITDINNKGGQLEQFCQQSINEIQENIATLKDKIESVEQKQLAQGENIQKIQTNQSVHDVRLGNVEGIQEIQDSELLRLRSQQTATAVTPQAAPQSSAHQSSTTGFEQSAVDSVVKLTPKPTTFHGKTNEDVNKWIRLVDAYLDAARIPEHNKASIARLFLRDYADTWFVMYQQTGQYQGTWTSMTTGLKGQFAGIDPKKTAREKIRELKQRRSVQEYFDELSTCFMEIPEMTESEKIDRFLCGLRQDVRFHVELNSHEDDNLLTIVQKAATADNILFQQRRKGNGTNANFNRSISYVSYRPRQAYQTSSPVTPMEVGTLRTMQRRNKPTPSKSSLPSRQGNGQQLTCYHCGKLGHMKRECPMLRNQRNGSYRGKNLAKNDQRR